MISAILLAAGESRRMGDFKQLLDYRGRTFVECCADNLLAAHLDEVIVVTGHRQADVRRALSARSVRVVYNEDYRAGMSSSIQCGVRALDARTEAVLIALADQPQIPTAVINQVIAAYHTQGSRIVIPTYDGRRGHPVLLSAQLQNEILAIDPAIGLKQVVVANQAATFYTEVSNDEVLWDFDYPEDYERRGE